MKQWRQWPIKKISFKNDRYLPEKLAARGEASREIFTNCLAVVGARKMTRYGETVIERLIPGLVQAGLTIVSGFMYGVDSKAHRACLESGGRTIAVFGCGLDVLCPAENGRLYNDILAGGGLVLSEYEHDRKPERWMFPQRNRIVAGLSKGVLVIEGDEKSGSLITARIGFKQNKPVMAVPGPITSSLSKGTNWLIRNGATAVTSAAEVLETLKIEIKAEIGARIRVGSELTDDEKWVLEELAREELGVDELARKLGKNAAEMGVLLSMMSLKGLVAEKEGKYNKLISNF